MQCPGRDVSTHCFWILRFRTSLTSYPWRVVTWIILSVLVVPFVLGVGAAWIQDRIFNPSDLFVKGKVSQWLSNVVEPPIAPTVWDWLFTADTFPESGFLVMRFQDGTQVGGAFAKMSMALTSPEAQGVFLEREWNLDDSGNVLTEVTGTAGISHP